MSDYDQTKGELCLKCGWAMKFPEEPCRCELERENAALRQQLADIKSVLFAVRADLEPADREPAVLMIGDGILAALLDAARAKEGQT